jgi:predicted MFS family arabinose efflux permease
MKFAVEDPRYKWYVVAILFLISAVNYGDRMAISAVFPLIREDLRLSDIELGAVGSFFLWTYGIGSPLAGFVADRYSRRRIIVWTLAAWSLITAYTAVVPDIHHLLAARLLLGLAECAYIPASIALIAEYHSAETRGTAMSLQLAGFSFGLVLGGTLAGYLGEHHGWRLVFWVLGITGLLVAVVAHFVLRDAPARHIHERYGRQSMRRVAASLFRVPTYWVLLLESLLVSVTAWVFWSWLPLYLQETFSLSLTSAGFSGTSLYQVPAVIGILAGGVFSDRLSGPHPQRRMLILSLCYFAAAPFLLAFAARPALSTVSVCVFLFSLLRGLGGANEFPILCDILDPRLRSTAVGVMNTLNVLAGGVGIVAAAHLKGTRGLGFAFAAISVIMFTAAVLTLPGYFWFYERDLVHASRARTAVPSE